MAWLPGVCHWWMRVVLLGSSTDLVLITWAEAPLFWSSSLRICLAPACWEMLGTSTHCCLPGESQGWGSLVSCRLWGRTESDTTEAMQQQHTLQRTV